MFYQSKQYFLLLLELLFFTFVILETESKKIEIMKKIQHEDKLIEQKIKYRIANDVDFRNKVIKFLKEK
jgi:hypothetical protein